MKQSGHDGNSGGRQESLRDRQRHQWERVVFNIKGNDYRLVTAIDYARQAVFIKWIGTQAEYDEIDVRTVQYGDQTYQKRRQP